MDYSTGTLSIAIFMCLLGATSLGITVYSPVQYTRNEDMELDEFLQTYFSGFSLLCISLFTLIWMF